ncbi:MAG: ABC transporter permease [Candidatus Dormiibacterota bacterium]
MNSQGLIRVIAEREFVTRARSRVFVITTALTVIAIGGYILLQAFVFNKSTTSLNVGFVGTAQSIAAPVRAEAAGLGVGVTIRPYTSAAAGRADVRSGALDALVIGSGASTTVIVQSRVDPTLQTTLNDVAREQVLTQYLTQHALPPGDVERQLNFSVNVNELSPINAERVKEIVIGLLVAGILYTTLVVYGQLVAAGVIEEKSNRIVEILLATVRPWQLLIGKIIGIGLVALVQIVLVAGVALVLGSATKLVSIPTLGVDVVISGVVWFVLGYLTYALLFAAAGSMVSRQEEVSSVSLPVILVLVAAWIVAITVAAPDPGSTATAVCSFIPLFAPVIMPVRIAAGVAPFWQVAISVLLVIGTIYLFAALAGRIYRNSVLRVGSRVKLGEALGLPPAVRAEGIRTETM